MGQLRRQAARPRRQPTRVLWAMLHTEGRSTARRLSEHWECAQRVSLHGGHRDRAERVRVPGHKPPHLLHAPAHGHRGRIQGGLVVRPVVSLPPVLEPDLNLPERAAEVLRELLAHGKRWEAPLIVHRLESTLGLIGEHPALVDLFPLVRLRRRRRVLHCGGHHDESCVVLDNTMNERDRRLIRHHRRDFNRRVSATILHPPRKRARRQFLMGPLFILSNGLRRHVAKISRKDPRSRLFSTIISES